MPRRSIVRVGRDRARCQLTHSLGTGGDQPIVIGECNEGLGVVWPLGYGTLRIRERISQLLRHARKVSCNARWTIRAGEPTIQLVAGQFQRWIVPFLHERSAGSAPFQT